MIEIHRIKAIKQTILFLRFIETAAGPISECNGQFELLPPASQTSLLNAAFSAKYLRFEDHEQFGALIQEYFSFSPVFQ